MLYDQITPTGNCYIPKARVMLMDRGDFAEYIFRQFPYDLNDLTDLKFIFPSLIMEIALMRMPLKTTRTRCMVLNALIAYYPNNIRLEVAVVEFKAIQKPYEVEPDISCCKRLLLDLIGQKWGVRFKGKELIAW